MSDSLFEFEIESRSQCAIELLQFVRRQASDVSRQARFGQTNQFNAVDTEVVLQPLAYSDRHLGAESMLKRVYWSANDRGKPGIDQTLRANDNEDPLSPGIGRIQPLDQVEFAPEHLSFRQRVLEHILGFGIQFVGMRVDDRNIAVAAPLLSGPVQIPADRPFKEVRPVRVSLVDLRRQFFRECN